MGEFYLKRSGIRIFKQGREVSEAALEYKEQPQNDLCFEEIQHDPVYFTRFFHAHEVSGFDFNNCKIRHIGCQFTDGTKFTHQAVICAN